MSNTPTFFYQQYAAPPKAALDVVEPVRDYTPSTQIPPAFFEPEPLYFLGGIAAQLDPQPIEVSVTSIVGAFATTQHYPIWEEPSLLHILEALGREMVVLPEFPEFIQTLPDATWDGFGMPPMVWYKEVGGSANEVHYQPIGVQTIDGQTSYKRAEAYHWILFMSDKTNWMKFSHNEPADVPSRSTRTVSSDTTLLSTDDAIFADAIHGPFTITVPTNAPDGKIYIITNGATSGNIITVQDEGGLLIKGQSTAEINTPLTTLTILKIEGRWIIE